MEGVEGQFQRMAIDQALQAELFHDTHEGAGGEDLATLDRHPEQRLVNGHVLSAQDNALTAFRLAVAESNGAGFARETNAVERMRAVKFEDVQALAREVFDPEAVLRMVQQ